MTPGRWASVLLAVLVLLALAIVLRLTQTPAPFELDLPTTAEQASPGAPVLNPGGAYAPSSLDPKQPIQILLALHGQSGNGPGIARRLQQCAQMHGWLLIAPTLAYRDYLDPDNVRRDAQENLPQLEKMVADLRLHLSGARFEPRLLVYGFSRGAQMAHRFSLVYPRQVAAAAVLSAGSYTLPEDQDATHSPLAFPFGAADLQSVDGAGLDLQAFSRIPFWIGVGGADTNPLDTARAWDQVEGSTRLERARMFAHSLEARGMTTSLQVFRGTGHEETQAMRASACTFLAAHARRP